MFTASSKNAGCGRCHRLIRRSVISSLALTFRKAERAKEVKAGRCSYPASSPTDQKHILLLPLLSWHHFSLSLSSETSRMSFTFLNTESKVLRHKREAGLSAVTVQAKNRARDRTTARRWWQITSKRWGRLRSDRAEINPARSQISSFVSNPPENIKGIKG